MGGSLALALRGQCAALLGVDPDPQTLALAQQMNLADQLSAQAADVLPQADLVVLAAPATAILDLLSDLPRWHPGPVVVLDLGSTKAQITAAMQSLPGRFDPLGGHPMCGKERGSLAHAEAGLYQGAAFALVRLPRTTPRACQLAEQLALAVGAHPVWLDAQEHDRWAAATSHTPYLAANALAAITPLEARPLVGPGWRSAARLAATPRGMFMGILRTNRGETLAHLRRLQGQLAQLEDCLEQEDWARLEELLAQGAGRYAEMIGGAK